MLVLLAMLTLVIASAAAVTSPLHLDAPSCCEQIAVESLDDARVEHVAAIPCITMPLRVVITRACFTALAVPTFVFQPPETA